MKNPGRVATKLAKILQDAGVPIPDATCFWVQQGGYRHRYWDLARWGADWRAGSQFWRLYSYSTMSDCVRYGVVLNEEESSTDLEVLANASQADVDERNEKLERKKREQQAKIDAAEKRYRERAAERRKRSQERFRVFRCNVCGGQFPWEWPAEKKCGCGSADIRDVSADVLFGYDE